MEQSMKKAAKPKQAASARASQTTKPTKKRSTRALTTKRARVLKQLERSRGATIKDLMRATGWQAHSVRGFLSGTVRKKLGLPLQSERTDKGRRYWIEPLKRTGS